MLVTIGVEDVLLSRCHLRKRKKTYRYLRKLKIKDYKNCLQASQIINTVNYLEKKETDVDCLKEDKKEFIKNELILKA